MTSLAARREWSALLPDYVIDPAGCWIWQGPRTGGRWGGYGYFKRNGLPVYAHRASYEAFVGPIGDGLAIDHLCRNPSCVNPEHLEAVTPAENARRGHVAKLTSQQALEIRHRAAAGESRRSLAEEFGVSKSAVKHIVRGRTWRP